MNEISIEKEINQSRRKRFEFIESRLFWEDKVSRKDLINYFKISIPQATNDIKDYTNKFPQNITYDKSSKEHKVGDNFKPHFISPDSKDYRNQLLVHSVETDREFYYGTYPEFQNFHELNRPINVSILKKVTKAINQKKSIHIEYHSIDEEKGIKKRWISPHALVYDGYRLHLRAYCYDRVQFRDFNLGRVLSVEEKSFDSDVDFELDYQWTNFIDAIIKPHPKFIDHQRDCIEHEYGMENGMLKKNIRAASWYYFFRRYGFDVENYIDIIDPCKQQIILENKDEIKMKKKLLDEMSITKLKEASYTLKESETSTQDSK